MDMLLSAITFLSILLSNEVIFFAVVGAMIFIAEKRPEKRKKILFALLITALLAVGLKLFFARDRPCMEIPGLIDCPSGSFLQYSFPSGHAVVAFLLMIAFLDKPSFPFFWIFAFFVAFSRIFLGVHTFEDVAGALVLAPIAYYISDMIWRRFDA